MTKVAIIDAGKGGRPLLEMLAWYPTVTTLAVADVNAWAPGPELARRLNIPVATDLRSSPTSCRVTDGSTRSTTRRGSWSRVPCPSGGASSS